MSRAPTIVFGLALSLSAFTHPQAQMANTREGPDARDTPRATNTARSGRTMPPSRDEAPSSTGSTNRKQPEPSGLSATGICIGCGEK